MRLSHTLGLALAAAAFAAPAFAGGCNYGHSASVVASAEPAEAEAPMISTPVDGTLVAQLDCAGLTGEALTDCEAKTSN